jgi:hypothetical protein
VPKDPEGGIRGPWELMTYVDESLMVGNRIAMLVTLRQHEDPIFEIIRPIFNDRRRMGPSSPMLSRTASRATLRQLLYRDG